MFFAVESQGKSALTRVLNHSELSLVDPFKPPTPWGISFEPLHVVKMGRGTDAVSLVLVRL